MERYTRMLLHFIHAMARRRRSVEVFVFSTRLTRITRPFVGRPDRRGADARARRVKDWWGGTRIGEALRTFHVQWGRRVLRRGPVVLLISDGWDLGEPEMLRPRSRACSAAAPAHLAEPADRLSRVRAADPGMRAALPHVDDFLSVRNMASLEALAASLEATPDRHRGVQAIGQPR